MRTCPSRDTLSDLLDIAVPPTRGVATRRRLRRCDVCAWIFADEESLRIAARTYGAPDSAPPRLRGAVLAALALAPIPVSAPRRKWVMGTLAGATVASLAAFSVLAVLFRPAIRRLPAYAEVETSMRQIRTARWEVDVDSPPIPSPSQVVRRDIWSQIMAPTDKGRGTAAWHGSEQRLAGRLFWRFESRIGQGAQTKSGPLEEPGLERMTKPGYRQTICADPSTHRVVRSEMEDYDGQTHTVTISDGFVYDVTQPDALFRAAAPHPPRK